MEKIIQYFDQPAKVKCDEKCNKAWGQGRPRFYPELGRDKVFGDGHEHYWPENDPSITIEFDSDDWGYLPDGELGVAPVDPGTSEGGHCKPLTEDQKGNKWCIRACERCAMSSPGKHNEPLDLPSFETVQYNFHSRNSK